MTPEVQQEIINDFYGVALQVIPWILGAVIIGILLKILENKLIKKAKEIKAKKEEKDKK